MSRDPFRFVVLLAVCLIALIVCVIRYLNLRDKIKKDMESTVAQIRGTIPGKE